MRKAAAIFVTYVGASVALVGCRFERHVAAGSGDPDSASLAGSISSGHQVTVDAADGSIVRDPLAIPSASVAAVVNPMHLPVYSGPTGEIDGTVLVVGPEAPDIDGVSFRSCPAAIETYRKAFRSGVPREDGSRTLADALVLVTGYQGFVEENEPAVRITLGRTCAFPSRTIAMTFGQRLEIANESNLPFGPYLEHTYNPVVRVTPPHQAGEPVRIYPPRADYFPLRDRLQPFIHEDVYVLRQPLHAVSNLAGQFHISGVPVGHATVSARLVAVGDDASQEVDVRAASVTRVELTLTYKQAAAVAPSGPIIR
jgi:hypothetical protein